MLKILLERSSKLVTSNLVSWFTKILSRKLQTNIQSEYHRQNARAPCPDTFLSSHFKISQFFSSAVCLSEISFYGDCFSLNSQTISWKPLTPEKLQFSLLWICPQSLIHWTTLHFFTDFSILLVYLVMLSLGFAHI